MLLPYLSLYIIALGATATQLGIVNSFGMVFAGFISLFSGFLIDRMAPKKIYLAGIGLLIIAYVTLHLPKLDGYHFRHDCLLVGKLGQYAKLRYNMRQLPGGIKDRATGMMLVRNCKRPGCWAWWGAGRRWLVTMFGG